MSDSAERRMIGRELQGNFVCFCDKTAEVFGRFPFLKEQEISLRILQQSIVRPFSVAVIGRMKAGKSSLINAIIGRDLAVTGTEETTATVNVFTYDKALSEKNMFTVHWKDAPPENLPMDVLHNQWNGKELDVVEKIVQRTSYIQLYSDLEFLRTCEIIDTPGTGSVVDAHSKVAEDFFAANMKEGRTADAFIYVVSGEARETDISNLDVVRKNNALPGSTPYNSVAVFHKWDNLYCGNVNGMEIVKDRAMRTFNWVGQNVAEVIPVSAPLAAASKSAPDAYFREIARLSRDSGMTGKTAEEIVTSLQNKRNVFSRDSEDGLRRLYKLPLPSYKCIVRDIALHEEWFLDENRIDTEAVRRHFRQLSGIDQLFALLDTKFFKQSELLRQRRKYTEVLNIERRTREAVKEKFEALEQDRRIYEKLKKENVSGDILDWVRVKSAEVQSSWGDLDGWCCEIDDLFANNELSSLIKDKDIAVWCREIALPMEIVGAEELQTIETVFDRFIGDSFAIAPEFKSRIDAVRRTISRKIDLAEKDVRDRLVHILHRLNHFLSRGDERKDV